MVHGPGAGTLGALVPPGLAQRAAAGVATEQSHHGVGADTRHVVQVARLYPLVNTFSS